ncbi:hypothetical protein AcW1_003895 [Taiwanofungus camphoratus]|nr:hypothetical protein AcW1_003895 [Antrodia cinnamomea]
MQMTAFHVQDIITPDQMILVNAMGELGSVLWMSAIDNMEVYLSDLTILIGNVLDAFGTLDPAKILIKIKLHVLVHLPDHIRRRGPAVCFSTELPVVISP